MREERSKSRCKRKCKFLGVVGGQFVLRAEVEKYICAVTIIGLYQHVLFSVCL